ncbi:hypothetical protein SLEP1_g51579 [Rubroshorea leprosula]|uniref:Ion transport domain-containing protein n=1 Tax=Rubroshorea leprosula TaxID=152421 RepID=A0AAV5M3M1_9ROSI|nr:hypothetical protein SLEP1_g51579 [Rubroshorea leprosula]
MVMEVEVVMMMRCKEMVSGFSRERERKKKGAWVLGSGFSRRTQIGFSETGFFPENPSRFESDKSLTERYADAIFPRKVRNSLASVMESVRRGVEMGSQRIKSFRKPMNSQSPRNKSEKDSVVVNDETQKCLDLNKKLAIIASVLRTFMDAFYIIHMIFQFRTGFIAAPSRVFGRGELIVDPWAIAKRYLFTYFIIDVLSILPLPQLVTLHVIPLFKDRGVTLVTKELLKYTIICQYVPRILRIVPLYIEVTRTSGIITETAWAGAALNLFLYMLASHVLGAIWYMISVERCKGKERCLWPVPSE